MFGKMGRSAFGRFGRGTVVSPYLIANDADMLAYYDALDTANVSVSTGSVGTWTQSAGSWGSLVQGTAGFKPAHTVASGTSAKVTFDATDDYLEANFNPLIPKTGVATNLPDASNGDTGKGFTCTGIAQAADGTWWVGNDGRNLAAGGNGLQLPSLVHLSTDFATKLGEILLKPLFSGIGSVQGVAIDPSNGSLWFASLNENLVRNVSVAGASLGSFAHTSPNALAWDTLRDELVVGAGPTILTVKWYSRAGVNSQTKTLPSPITDPDHFWFNPRDGASGQLWITEGANDSTGVMYIFDVSTSAVMFPTAGHSLTDGTIACNAVEGIFYDFTTRTMTIINDGYFHGVSASPLNRAIQYSFFPPLGSAFAIFGVFRWPASEATTDSVITLGNPLATANYGGVGFFAKASATDTIRIISQTGITSGSQDIMDFVISSTGTKAFYYAEFDYVAKTCSLYQNATLIGTQTMTNNSTCGHTGRKAMVGARRTDSTGAITNFSNPEVSCLGYKRGLSSRVALTAQVRTKHGL